MTGDAPLELGVHGRPPWFSPEAEQLLRPTEKVVPVLGAGISIAGGLDGAAGLAAWILGLPIAAGVQVAAADHRSLFAVADAVVGYDAARAVELRRLVADRLRLRDDQFLLTDSLRAMVHVPSRLIITFNYDELPEAAADSEGVPYRTATQFDRDVLQQVATGDVPPELVILHLHGWVGAPETIVLDWRGYAQQVNSNGLKLRFEAFAQSKNLLFLGLSMNEAYLLTWLQELALSPPRHVCVCGGDTYAAANVSQYRHGTVPAIFPAGEYSEMDSVVMSLFGGVA